MPDTIMTTSAFSGRLRVERCAVSSGEGSECENESVDCLDGSGHRPGSLGRAGLMRDILEVVWEKMRSWSKYVRAMGGESRKRGDEEREDLWVTLPLACWRRFPDPDLPSSSARYLPITADVMVLPKCFSACHSACTCR